MKRTTDHAERAEELFRGGYNCAQSVFAAFCDLTGMDEETALKISSPFGGGMGRMREVCGALSGAFMALGMLNGYSDADAGEKKAELYSQVREIAERFKAEHGGTIICRELLSGAAKGTGDAPTPRNGEFYRTRPCVGYVRAAAEIFEDFLRTHDYFKTQGEEK